MLNDKSKLNPIHHLMGTMGWGGNPKEMPYMSTWCLKIMMAKYALTVKAVPVDRFCLYHGL
jgi:hypothetical protein